MAQAGVRLGRTKGTKVADGKIKGLSSGEIVTRGQSSKPPNPTLPPPPLPLEYYNYSSIFSCEKDWVGETV